MYKLSYKLIIIEKRDGIVIFANGIIPAL